MVDAPIVRIGKEVSSHRKCNITISHTMVRKFMIGLSVDNDLFKIKYLSFFIQKKLQA